MRPPPLVVLEGRAFELADSVEREVASAGWRLVTGWHQAGPGVVCTGRVDGKAAASASVLAAVSGAGLGHAGVDEPAPDAVVEAVGVDPHRAPGLVAQVDGRLPTAQLGAERAS